MLNFEKEELLKTENIYSIGGQTFKILSYGEFNSEKYLRGLAHLAVRSETEEMVRVHLIESKSTGSTPPEEWLNWPTIDPYSGELLDFGDNRALFNSTEPYFIFVDYASRDIYYWIDDFCRLSPNETASPLRMVFHLWFDPTELFLCHAAGLGFSKKGILLTGKSGSGKSTSTLSCLNTELKYAGDDFILVDSEKSMVYSLYSAAKLNIDQFDNFPHLKPLISNIEHVPREKGHVYINESFTDSMINQFSIQAILLPTITGLENTFIKECSKIDAIKALVPSSVWILRTNKKSVEKMKLLISKTPTFRLMAGVNLEQIAPTLIDFINEN
ncbi:phosphoenolpyruvate carboxykinase (ATP) [Emticicia fontis]